MRKSQTSVEFIIVLAFVLIVIASMLAINQRMMTSVEKQIRAEKAKITLANIKDAADRVYSQGVGAQEEVYVNIPRGVRSTSVSERTVLISLESATSEKRDIYHNMDYVVVGSLPENYGQHWITVRAMPGYVLINYALLDISPGTISLQLYPTNTSQQNLTIRNVIQDTVSFNMTYESDSEIELEVQQADSIDENSTISISTNISVFNNTRPGVYQGLITVNSSSGTVTQTHQIPILVRVPGSESCTECPALVLYPGFWDAGSMIPGTVISNEFYVCSNTDQTLSVDLDFSDNTYMGFDQGIQTKTEQLFVFPNDCETLDVYINTTSAPNQYMTSDLRTESVEGDDESTIYFNVSEDDRPPEVQLISPEENYESISSNIMFVYNATDSDSGIENCTLWINDSIEDTDYTVTEGVNQTFTILGLTNGFYNWTVNCTDDSALGNSGQAPWRNLTVNFTTVTAVPELAFEEDFDPQWTTEVQVEGDGLEAVAVDEAGDGHGNYPPPDYVEFDFPDLGIAEGYGVSFAQFSMRHYEQLDGGWFDADDRHQIECFNGGDWMVIEAYPHDSSYIYYESPDLSTCIYNSEVANDARIRVTYDPADDAGASQYFDWAQLVVNISPISYANLWELTDDLPYPVDFSSGLNFTDNTFGRGSGDDGWDWQEDVYGGSFSAAEFNVDPNMNGNEQDSTVADDDRIEVRLGGGAKGAPENPNENYYTGPITSGAYGVEFNVTNEQYDKLNSGGKAILSFDWETDIGIWGNNLDSSEEIWVKARLITPTETVWLGSDLDSGDNDADTYNEIFFADPPYNEDGKESIDISSYISSAGTYYLDLGGALGDWDTDEEGLGVYFDNVMIIFI